MAEKLSFYAFVDKLYNVPQPVHRTYPAPFALPKAYPAPSALQKACHAHVAFPGQVSIHYSDASSYKLNNLQRFFAIINFDETNLRQYAHLTQQI